MSRHTYLLRLTVGAAAEAVDLARSATIDIITFPRTVAMTVLARAFALQQTLTTVAARGEAILEEWEDTPVEQPDWATFDEDTMPPETAAPAQDPAE